MGRGRQKAKQTKVARELKYHSSSIDVSALQRELAGVPEPPSFGVGAEDDDDVYRAYSDDEDDEGDQPRYASARR